MARYGSTARKIVWVRNCRSTSLFAVYTPSSNHTVQPWSGTAPAACWNVAHGWLWVPGFPSSPVGAGATQYWQLADLPVADADR